MMLNIHMNHEDRIFLVAVKPIRKFEVYGETFFAHHTMEGSGPCDMTPLRGFTVSEYKTGTRVVYGYVKCFKAVATAKERLAEKGEAKVKKAIAEFAKKHGRTNP
jgi:hypothetical protein